MRIFLGVTLLFSWSGLPLISSRKSEETILTSYSGQGKFVDLQTVEPFEMYSAMLNFTNSFLLSNHQHLSSLTYFCFYSEYLCKSGIIV